MTLDEFLSSVPAAAPPDLPPPLLALWHDAKGDWDRAHKCVDTRDDAGSMWVHAYLHRKEGDGWNARYWYRHAGRAPVQGPLEAEWRDIASALLREAE